MGRTDRPRLILLDGPPAVGKTTLAERYVDDHPLALNLDIDSLRYEVLLRATAEDALGRFQDRREALAAQNVSHPERSVEPDAERMAAIIDELNGVAQHRRIRA